MLIVLTSLKDAQQQARREASLHSSMPGREEPHGQDVWHWGTNTLPQSKQVGAHRFGGGT